MSRSNGLIGIDIAYIIALIGCLFASIIFGIGGRLHMLSHDHYYLIMDFFPALFFFLNGLTVTLTMRDRRISSRRLLSYLGKRGMILVLVGLLFIKVWPLNLLFASGIFYLIAPFFAQWNNIILRSLLVVVWLLSIVLINFDVPTTTLYSGIHLGGANFKHLFSFLLFNGHYSPLPWFMFFVAGLIYGRSDLRPRGIMPPSSLVAILFMLAAVGLEGYSTKVYGVKDKEDILSLVGLNIKFYLPAFLVFATALCFLVMNVVNYLFRSSLSKSRLALIHSVSGSKYSIYFFVMFFGSIIASITNTIIFRDKWVIFFFALALISFSLYISYIWRKRISQTTPIEWMIKKVSSSTKK